MLSKDSPTVLLNFEFADSSDLRNLYGIHNYNLKYIEKKLTVQILSRGQTVQIYGSAKNIGAASQALKEVYRITKKDNSPLSACQLDAIVKQSLHEDGNRQSERLINTPLKKIRPYTANQHKYLESLDNNTITFGIGSAGTGKTYLAIARAVEMFLNNDIKRVILTRPAVEAGERIGFLPGDMKEKVDPYLQPIYDAIYDVLPVEVADRYFINQQFQVAPLAFMRGRTLKDAFVILDEAQNATSIQLKMFLTRLGYGSKMVITGDLSQTDLPKNMQSGLSDAIFKLKDIDDINVVKFGTEDISRHPLISKIIEAYEN